MKCTNTIATYSLVIFWEKTGFHPSNKTELLHLVGWKFLQEIAQENTYLTTENNVRKLQFDVEHRTNLS